MKQASRSWNLRLDETVKEFGFIKNSEEACVYKKVSGSSIEFLILYVDDILLIGNDIPLLESVKTSLKKSFSMKNLGKVAYILGIKIYGDRSKYLIGISQSTYIDKVLKRFNIERAKKGFLPMSHGIKLSKTQCPSTTDEQECARICTRPDMSYALSVTSRDQSDPGMDHWTAVEDVPLYLRKDEGYVSSLRWEEELVVRVTPMLASKLTKTTFKSKKGFVCWALSWKSSKQFTSIESRSR